MELRLLGDAGIQQDPDAVRGAMSRPKPRERRSCRRCHRMTSERGHKLCQSCWEFLAQEAKDLYAAAIMAWRLTDGRVWTRPEAVVIQARVLQPYLRDGTYAELHAEWR